MLQSVLVGAGAPGDHGEKNGGGDRRSRAQPRAGERASLHQISTSPLVSRRALRVLRSCALAAHALVVSLGIYTRGAAFFTQFTNITNLGSAWYFACTLRASRRYADLLARRQAQEAYAPSRAAEATRASLAVIASMHLIVTAFFWTLVLPEFVGESVLDWAYGLMAHGVTLAFVAAEVLLTNVHFPYRYSLALEAVMGFYLACAVCVQVCTGAPVYSAIDITVQRNRRVVVPLALLSGFAFYGAGAGIAAARVWVVALAEERGRAQVRGAYAASAEAAATKAMLARTGKMYSAGGAPVVRELAGGRRFGQQPTQNRRKARSAGQSCLKEASRGPTASRPCSPYCSRSPGSLVLRSRSAVLSDVAQGYP